MTKGSESVYRDVSVMSNICACEAERCSVGSCRLGWPCLLAIVHSGNWIPLLKNPNISIKLDQTLEVNCIP